MFQVCNHQRPFRRPIHIRMDITPYIDRTLAGEGQAFAEVVRTYQHMVHTVCHRVLWNTEDAEEATQDTFVKAYQHLHGWNRTSKFSTWLYTIAYRTAVSHKRRATRPSVVLDSIGDMSANVDHDGLERQDRRRFLDKALAQLPTEDAAILNFFYLEELSVEEIVTVTGMSASNVKVKLHRGRKRLLDILEHDLHGKARSLLLDDA